jgi:hypothetical protein
MANLLSPGVQVKEIDLTNVIPSATSSIGAFVGNFVWGPVEDVVTIGTEKEFTNTFGKPHPLAAVDFTTAAMFLKYSNTLRVVRAVTSAARNATSDDVATAILIKNDVHYEQLSPTLQTIEVLSPLVAVTAYAGERQITVDDVTGLTLGDVISGAGVATGTTITAISGNVITLSQPLLGTIPTSSFVNEGGTWYETVPSTYQYKSSSFCLNVTTGSSLICSQSFDYTTSDINMDITNIVKGWLCGCVPNEGIILVRSLETVATNGIDSTIKFFSKETNTIYQPYIDISWDDSVYTTGSMVPLTGIIPYTVIVQNLSKEYKFGSIPRINVFAREKFPLKNFIKGYQQINYLSSSLLPSASYYSIKDNESENIVVDFDENTKLSSDGNIHYFKIDTTGLPVERFYRILIKTTFNNQTDIFDNGNIFKITR